MATYGYLQDGYYGESAAEAPVSERAAFIQRTYVTLALAVAAFVALETVLLQIMLANNAAIGKQVFATMMAVSPWSWLGLMVLFIGGGFVASYMASKDTAPAMKYLGLALYVGIEAIFFLPILTIAELHPKLAQQQVALQAGGLTLLVFAGLTAYVLISKKDFSFLGGFLTVMGFLALGVVLFAVFTGMGLGLWFSAVMIGLACLYILYDTSNVLHHYSTTQHVAAALALFASLAMLFYYVLRYLMQYYLASEE